MSFNVKPDPRQIDGEGIDTSRPIPPASPLISKMSDMHNDLCNARDQLMNQKDKLHEQLNSAEKEINVVNAAIEGFERAHEVHEYREE